MLTQPTPYINSATNVVDMESLLIFLKIAANYHPFITIFLACLCIVVGCVAYYQSKKVIEHIIYKEEVKQNNEL